MLRPPSPINYQLVHVRKIMMPVYAVAAKYSQPVLNNNTASKHGNLLQCRTAGKLCNKLQNVFVLHML